MTKYIDKTHPDAFMDMEVKQGSGEICPICKGHGGWNLRINAYGPGEHFSTICGNCMGTGHLKKNQSCFHSWKIVGKAKSLTYYVCEHCGEKQVIDSSD